MTKMKILIADTNANDRLLLKTMLTERGYEVVEAAQGTAAWEALQCEDAPYLAILDSTKTGIGGIEICRQLRKRGDAPFVYTILLGTVNQRQEITEGIEIGADDYLTKPVDPLDLEVRVRGGKRAIQCRERLRNSEKIINYQALHDPLTGTWNRAAVIDALRRELARVRREQTPVAILLVAFDGLRKLNRHRDYAGGDSALHGMAQRLVSIVRPYDTVGRYGGEVFLIVTPGCDEAGAVAQASRVQESLAGESVDAAHRGKYPLEQDDSAWITLSIGVAAVQGDCQVEPLLNAAEGALKKARRAGGNRVASVSVIITDPAAKAS